MRRSDNEVSDICPGAEQQTGRRGWNRFRTEMKAVTCKWLADLGHLQVYLQVG